WTYPYITPNTSTYVQLIKVPLIPTGPGGVPASFTWDRTTLDQAIKDVCTLSSQLTVSWIDQDGFVHLTQQPTPFAIGGNGPLTLLFPQSAATTTGGAGSIYPAPIALSDDVTDSSAIGYESFALTYDSTGYVISGYVRGASTWINNPTEHAIIGGIDTLVPFVEVMGTGWVDNLLGDYSPQGGAYVAPSWLSAYIDAPQAGDAPTRDHVGTSAVSRARVPLVKGSCDVVGQPYFFAPGMILTITSHPAMLAAANLMIQTVTTTMLSGDYKTRQKLEWGTAPNTTLGLRANAQLNNKPIQKKPPTPWTQWRVESAGTLTGPSADGTSYTDTQPSVVHPMLAQLLNANGASWAKQGVPATWWVIVHDALGVDVTASRDWLFEGANVPFNVTTDAKGSASVTYTTPSSATAQPGDTSFVWISGYPAL